MGKLHELLAVEPTLEGASARIILGSNPGASAMYESA
jgi:hypothetical protein